MIENISANISEYPQNKGITLLTLKGDIDADTAPEFEKILSSVLQDNKINLVVDLKDVNYISSAGWVAFINEINGIREQKGDLVLAGMSSEVREVFDLLEFKSILNSYPNVEMAVKEGFKHKVPPGVGSDFLFGKLGEKPRVKNSC